MNKPFSWLKSTLYDGLNKQPPQKMKTPNVSYIYPALGLKYTQIGLFLTQYFLE